MPKTVVMPQMGESVAEGTIVRWLKNVGDPVERDEPLFEISTDKVDAEIPSPTAGVLSEIKVKEGETVPINTVVGVVDETASAPATGAASASAQGAPAVKTADKPAPAVPAAAPEKIPAATTAAAAGPRASEAPRAPSAPARTSRTCRTDRTSRTSRIRSMVSIGSQGTATFTRRSQDRARASRRCASHRRQRQRRPRDEGRHPCLY